ncbi:hypothetical protein SmJEL517_g04513 [Synchytrium microbalum]|uniref:Phosphatidylinositol 3,4,5-trisphosphate 3-phosphatase and dual-specificity protein phosphatase PTEN n=1 Tax=Synchytrium microbalum TaxID=1806994 RepID=A0A507BY59_9FUNG|nr:uncharacterized protein SmJEL517_g04513 [Synchytrium microbalum]TPX32362.1 hypothetical protein SmJEL517_g04513 [Synchytrium microbalum]
MNALFNPLRAAVSLQKRRFVDEADGFNLDLTYITDNVIAMGAPAERMDALYRNPIGEVRRFLDLKHANRYKIYNLCSEQCYPSSRFPSAPIAHYPFDDHNPPPIEIFQPFVNDVRTWLSVHEKNVAVVHCKAGKGRTGVMVCAYLLSIGLAKNAEEAIRFYGAARTRNQKGVTIPSQVRYVHYCDALIRNGWKYATKTLFLKSIVLHTIPHFSSMHPHPLTMITIRHTVVYTLNSSTRVSKTPGSIRITPGSVIPLCGDVKIEFFHCDTLRTIKMCRVWFNTAFIPPADSKQEPNMHRLVLRKWEVDGAHKDKYSKRFDDTFAVEIELLDLENSDEVEEVVDEDQEAVVPVMDRPTTPASSTGVTRSTSRKSTLLDAIELRRLSRVTSVEPIIAPVAEEAEDEEVVSKNLVVVDSDAIVQANAEFDQQLDSDIESEG